MRLGVFRAHRRLLEFCFKPTELLGLS